MSPLVLFGAYAVVMIAAMYGFVYIPNKKKQKRMQALHDSLAVGDEVVTMAGIVGRIVSREENYVTLLIDENTGATVKVVLYSVSQVISGKENAG